MFGYKKKQNKRRQCSLFAVCHRRQRALCRLPQTANWTRVSNLCNLGALGLTHLVILPSVADGKELAGADGKELAGADGKELAEGRRQRYCRVTVLMTP